MTKHKHSDLIIYWANYPDRIDQRNLSKPEAVEWHPFDGNWDKPGEWEYRMKPLKKPDFVWGYTVKDGGVSATYPASFAQFTVTTDGETGELKSVRKVGSPCPILMEACLRTMLDSIKGADLSLHWLDEVHEALRTN